MRFNRTLISSLATIGSLLGCATAQAVVITYSDTAEFVTATGSTLQTLPNVTFRSGADTPPGAYGTIVPGQFSISAATASGLNTIAAGAGLTSFNLDPTDNFIGKSGEEEYNIAPAAALTLYAFAFTIYEPSGSQLLNGCNQACAESEFSIRLLSGTTILSTEIFRPDNDVFDFMGFWSSERITRIEIREAAVDPTKAGLLADNEFFGLFYTGTTRYVPSEPPSTEVPEPATLSLTMLGLALAGLARRRARRLDPQSCRFA
jgi:hypothetical protein